MKVDTEVTAGTPDTKTGKTTFSFTEKIVDIVKDLSFDLHVGADADMTNKITVNVASMTAGGLGISGLNVADDSGAAATYAIDAIADVISTVSAQANQSTHKQINIVRNFRLCYNILTKKFGGKGDVKSDKWGTICGHRNKKCGNGDG
jgi:hypothetical protein